ncbi:MAG: glycosyltransferase [Ilumatobacteraceae bacterium]
MEDISARQLRSGVTDEQTVRPRAGLEGTVRIVLHRPFDLDAMERAASDDAGPRHYLYEVRRRTGAVVHQPVGRSTISWRDRLLGRLLYEPAVWAQARAVVRASRDGDIVLANDHAGFAIALLARLRRRRLRIACGLTWPTHRLVKLVGGTLRCARLIDVFTVNTAEKAGALRELLQLAPEQVLVEPEQTDLKFFRPAETRAENPRPFVYTAGREGRDYRTFCAAVESMDVDALVCAVSPSVAATKVMTVPEVIPANVVFEPLEWREFRDAYQRADVVVVPLVVRSDSPGLTVVMEAMACGRPVVVTKLDGYIGQLVADGFAIGAEPGDPDAMRSAIEWVLDHREEAEAMAAHARDMVRERHSSELLVNAVVEKVTRLSMR